MNFSIEELSFSQTASRLGIDNTPDAMAKAGLDILIKSVLQPLRDIIDCPITITSGFRCACLNKRIGGTKKSQHLTGHAADLVVHSMDLEEVFKVLIEKIPIFDQAIIEPGWIHVSFVFGRNRNNVLRATREGSKMVYSEYV